MRTDFHAINLSPSLGLMEYADTRLWQAVQWFAARIPWAGIWLVRNDSPASAPVCCRIDTWVRGVGIVAARYADRDPQVAVDIAAARLEQALARALPAMARRGHRPGAGDAPSSKSSSPPATHGDDKPRLAVVIERAKLPQNGSLHPWLKDKYGFDQISCIGLPAHLWQAAADGYGLAVALRRRLALSLLCRPRRIIVLGRAGDEDSPDVIDAEQQRVRGIVEQLRAWRIPVETLGLWVSRMSQCAIESQELTGFVPGDPEPADPSADAVAQEALSCG